MNGIQEVVGSIPISSTISFHLGTIILGYFVYILKSISTGRSYIGHSKHLNNRVAEHNSGKSKATRGRGPWELVYAVMVLWSRMLNRRVKQRTRELHESEENLRITLDSIGDAVISTDTDGRIVLFNHVVQKLTGFSLQEAVGRDVYEVFNIVKGQTNEPAENPVKKVLEEGKVVGLANHTVLISKDGKEYQIEDTGSPIKDDDGNITGVVLVFRDVTQSYKMQQNLKESEKKVEKSRYLQLFNNLDSAVAVYEAVDEGNDFIFKEFNKAGEKIENIKKEDINDRKELTQSATTLSRGF